MANIVTQSEGWPPRTQSFEDAFLSFMDDPFCDGGALEHAAANARSNSKAIGKIVECLYEKGILSISDVKNIADKKYCRDHFEIVS